MTAGLLIMLISALVGVACYNFICAGVDVPTGQTSKMMMLAGRRSGTRKENLSDVYIAKVADVFAKYISMDALKRSQLQNALDIAHVEMTPEQYVASAIARGVLIGLASIPMWFISPLFILVGIALGCLIGFARYQEVLDFVKKRRKRIEREIPRFTSAVAQNLEIDRDILRMFIAYRRVADKEFGAELDQTIADMKTGNYENALLKMEKRINSPLMSDVIRGLIGVLRGDDQRVYFKMLTFDMRQLEQNNLKKEAMKRPQAMQKYCMFMMFCILLIYGVVLVTEVVANIGILF